jgi:hypothetical protein
MTETIAGRHDRGQALVEFSLALCVFLMLLFGVVDLGRGIYQFNGVSQAAREIARVTSVHRGAACPPTCTSPETAAVIGVQKNLIPGLGNPIFRCVDEAGALKPIDDGCAPGDGVRVTAYASYTALMPLLGLVNKVHPPCTDTAFACVQGVSTVKIQ